jgi:hypothetical protein
MCFGECSTGCQVMDKIRNSIKINHIGVQVRAVITMASNPGKLESRDAIDKTVSMVANHLQASFKIVEKDALSTSSNPFAWLAR